jgi:hypothetical protein
MIPDPGVPATSVEADWDEKQGRKLMDTAPSPAVHATIERRGLLKRK